MIDGMRENRRLLLLGSSTNFNEDPFAYLEELLTHHFSSCPTLGYIPYGENHQHEALPEREMCDFLHSLGFNVLPVRSAKALGEINGLVVGDGNAHRLLAWLDGNCPIGKIAEHVARGMPYVGFGAGAILAGYSIQHAQGGIACRIPSPQGIHALNIQIAVEYSHEADRLHHQIREGHADCKLPVFAFYEHTIVRITGGKGEIVTGMVVVFKPDEKHYFISCGSSCLPPEI